MAVHWTIRALGNTGQPLDFSWLSGKLQCCCCFSYFHIIVHHSAYKITQIMTRHSKGDFYKIVEIIYRQCLTCPVHYPGKIIFAPRCLTSIPCGCLNTCSWFLFTCYPVWDILCSFYCMRVFQLSQSFSLLQKWYLHSGRLTVNNSFFFFISYFKNISFPEAPFYLVDKILIQESLTKVN